MRVFLAELLRNYAERAFRLWYRHARFQPADDKQIVVTTFGQPRAARLDLPAHRERNENLSRVSDLSAVKAFRRHADDGESVAIDAQRLTDDVVRGSESFLPAGIANNGERICIE